MSKEPECANQKKPLDMERRFLPGAMALGVTAPRHDLAGSSAVIRITALDCIIPDHSVGTFLFYAEPWRNRQSCASIR
jgi:hypothetical protein